MKFTIDIPDQLVTAAVAAAQRLNGRLPEQARAPIASLKFDAADARDVVIGWLKGAILNDLQQQAQVDGEILIAATQRELDALANRSS
jgi:hypothetical protein